MFDSLCSSLLSPKVQAGKKITLLDVGAYQGSFTDSFRQQFPDVEAILFEPTPNQYHFLKQKYQNDNSITVLQLGLSNMSSRSTLYLCEKPTSNSLLKPLEAVESILEVDIETLDNLWISKKISISNVDLIKIDTQGNDLRVLEGASETISHFQPLILAECIFDDLYMEQASFASIISYMDRLTYSPAGIFNTHSNENNLLAYCDILFAPKNLLRKFSSNSKKFFCHDPTFLLQENKMLTQACSERLSLINQLTQEADKRLEIILLLEKAMQK